MSFRSALARSAAPLRQHRPAVRALSGSAPRRGGHDDHHSQGSSSEANTEESFFSPTMRNSLIVIAAAVLAWPYLPSPSAGSASPSASPEAFSKAAATADAPFVTRWLAKNTPEAEVWTKRNDKHLELTKEAAEERLLFQEAEPRKVWRYRNTASFEAGSPHSIPVGGSADLSDLKIKRA